MTFFILDSTVCGTNVDSEPPMPLNPIQTVFDIWFKVPYGSASWDLELQSDISYKHAILAIAEVMVTRVHFLRIGYIFSFLPKTPKPRPKFLDSEKAWNLLVCDAATWIEGEKRKNKHKGIVHPWFVRIEDLAEEKTAAPKAPVSSNHTIFAH